MAVRGEVVVTRADGARGCRGLLGWTCGPSCAWKARERVFARPSGGALVAELRERVGVRA